MPNHKKKSSLINIRKTGYHLIIIQIYTIYKKIKIDDKQHSFYVHISKNSLLLKAFCISVISGIFSFETHQG